MRKIVYLYSPWIILLASFVILACFYNSLPSEIVITREIFGAGATLAPKSLFTVFRVPLIEAVCAFAIAVMIIRGVTDETLADYNSMWRVLLFTVAFKSLFQTFETISPEDTSLFFYSTLAVVIFGIILAFLPGFRFFPLPTGRGQNSRSSKKYCSQLYSFFTWALPLFRPIFGVSNKPGLPYILMHPLYM